MSAQSGGKTSAGVPGCKACKGTGYVRYRPVERQSNSDYAEQSCSCRWLAEAYKPTVHRRLSGEWRSPWVHLREKVGRAIRRAAIAFSDWVRP